MTERRGAYAILFDSLGRVALCEARDALHLPGGGIEPGETDEEAVVREVREELGRGVELSGRIGAVRHRFLVRRRGVHVDQESVFFAGSLGGPLPGPAGSHELVWLDVEDALPRMYHPPHARVVVAERNRLAG